MCSCTTTQVLYYYPEHSFVKKFQTPVKGGVIELRVESEYVDSPPPQIITHNKVAHIRGYSEVLETIKNFCKNQTYTIISAKKKSEFKEFISYLDSSPNSYVNIINMVPIFENYKEIKFQCGEAPKPPRKDKRKKVKKVIVI